MIKDKFVFILDEKAGHKLQDPEYFKQFIGLKVSSANCAYYLRINKKSVKMLMWGLIPQGKEK